MSEKMGTESERERSTVIKYVANTYQISAQKPLFLIMLGFGYGFTDKPSQQILSPGIQAMCAFALATFQPTAWGMS